MLKGVDALLKGLLCCLDREGLIDRENGAFYCLIAEEACEDCGTNSHKPGLVQKVEVLSPL